MLKNIIVFFVFLNAIFLYSQNITLKGTVSGKEEYLPYANVIAQPKNTAKNLTFAITDEAGKYQLTLQKNEAYTIKVTYMGYVANEFNIVAKQNTTKNIILKEAKNQLNEVVIELPVTVKEDTITYNTSKFITGKERKLKNVLKKLPGMEVDKNGGVTVMGKKVTKLLVDDKPFFGGGTKLGVENIPADAVDKVEVIDNYNQVGFLKGVSDTDEMALNVKLKEDKKQFVFGDVEAGKGNKEYYKAHTSLFYYSPKTNINFIGSSNNIGEKTFTFKDYLNFQGGVNAVFKNNFSYKGGSFEQFLSNKDILKEKHQFGAIHISQTTSPVLDVSGYAIFSHTNNESFETRLNQYTLFTEDKEENTRLKNTLGIANITFDYTPNSVEKWYFKTQVKRTKNNTDNNISSIIKTDENNIITQGESLATYVNQNIEWHKKHSQKHTFSAIANYTFDKNNPVTFWETTQPILQGLIPVDLTQNKIKLQQLKETEQHYFNTVFKDFWVLNRNHHIYSTIGNTYQSQRFLTSDYQILDNNLQNSFGNNEFNNRLNYSFHDFFVGLHYKFRTGIFTFKQGVHLHRYNWNVNQQNKFNKKKWNLLPDFKADIEFNKSKKITVSYQLKTDFADVSKLANRFYLQSYSSVFKGNNSLENELYHFARIRYHRFSLYRGIMLFFNANYTKKVKGYQSTVNFEGVNRFLTYQLIHNPSENWRVSSSIRKKIKQLRYKLRGSYSGSNYLQNINNNYTTNKRNNYSFEVGVETLFDKLPVVEVGYKRTIGNYNTGSSVSKFITNEPFIDVEYDFLNAFKFNFEYKFFAYQNKKLHQKNNYELAEASLLYQKEDSPFTFKIMTKNLFDARFKQRNNFSDYLISDIKTYIMPRVFMFSLGYKL